MNDINNAIDRRRLMAEALTQTKTIADAVALVERVLALSGAPPAGQAEPPQAGPVQENRKPRSDIGQSHKSRSDTELNRSRWSDDEIVLANQMLAMGKSNITIATALNRSFKAISAAITRGTLAAPDTPRRNGSRRGAYIGALKRGRNLRDYAKAEAVLGKLVTPVREQPGEQPGEQAAKEKFEAAIDQLLINGADVHEVVSNIKF